MEEYVHTLIAADPVFVPRPLQVQRFFEILIATLHFRIIADSRFQPGLRVIKPSGRFRTGVNPLTGETMSIAMPDHIKIGNIVDVSRTIEGLENYSVLASGEWTPEGRPLVLLTTDGALFEDYYLCDASCNIRPDLVSTSCWDEDAFANERDVPYFGEPCETKVKNGIFSHPWTGKLIEVPDAGYARFWIELEFGKFLLPKMAETLDVLSPTMVAEIEGCFGTRLVQGWRFN